MRDEKAVEACVNTVAAVFGRIDILINNASALWWQDITETPMSKFDLITSINVRGTFAMTHYCLPHMQANSFGRIINMSPPIKLDPGAYAGVTPRGGKGIFHFPCRWHSLGIPCVEKSS